jgi:archaellum biogenesis protein FlaJ (TadC family)
MADRNKALPPAQAAKVQRIQEAYARFLAKMASLREARKGVMVKYLKRIEDVKIAEIKKKIDTL